MADIINFDNITELNENKETHEQRSKFMPKHPFRLLMVGGSGSGKTNVLINMLVRYLNYDKIYIYAKELQQSKYQWLKNFYESIEENEELEVVGDFPIAYFADNTKDFIPLDELDEEKTNIIVFDDFVLEKKQDNMIQSFISGRHHNSSVIYLTNIFRYSETDSPQLHSLYVF